MFSNIDRIDAKELIHQLSTVGRYYFTSQEARLALKTSPEATKLALNRLRKQGLIATPAREFYVIVPPEYFSLECLPADQFIPGLMKQRDQRYYAGLLTAAQYYGAAHQRPQQFQVMLETQRRPLQCGKVEVMFVTRKSMGNVPTRRFNTPRGEILVSTPEATAIDLAGYPHHAGGLDHVATILAELVEEINPRLLTEIAVTAPLPWIQRLGYLLRIIDANHIADVLRDYVRNQAREYTSLLPSAPDENAIRDKEWKILVNTTIEPEL